jgi:hypothetical protein
MTQANWTLMTTVNKHELLKQFDDGDITFKEFFEQYELVISAELMDRISHSIEAVKIAEVQKRKSMWMLLAAAITFAFILSPPIYSRIFGYANAEECAIHTNSQFASQACYDLYPSVKDKTVTTPAKVAPAAAHPQTAPNALADSDFTDVPPVLTKPVHGAVKWYSPPKASVVPFEIKTSSDSSYFVKFVDATTGANVLGIFVEGGRDLSTTVPQGSYLLKYASGQRWYGYEDYFGKDTAYSKASSTFDFRADEDKASGYSITLYKVKNGNMRSSEITKAEF